jgi:hypothetical protein
MKTVSAGKHPTISSSDSLADETSPRFPPQLYDIIEHFCLGTRRLELFGSKSKARKGWVTIGENDLLDRPAGAQQQSDVQDYTPERYNGFLQDVVDPLGRNVLPQVDGRSVYNSPCAAS